ncbi:hypothetical protein [Mesorhizobium sp.]|uniref:hypothetical protein n=1 Tax=Mesorhizobium sp. TaxID=1871066 RepID=UPI002579B57E|nr:hypothetical protein [Mesorhizobium sp.]
MKKGTKATKVTDPATTLVIKQTEDETNGQATARVLLEPCLRHGLSASAFAERVLSSKLQKPGITDCAEYVRSAGGKAEGGDLGMASQMLSAQAITLDSMFTEFARRTAFNMNEYVQAAEIYARLAMKAQSNCRATLEALAKLHQPREQTVRHVHVNEGGQALVADQFHHHAGASGNGNPVKQSYATGTAGGGAALPCPDPQGNGVPIASREWKTTMPDARRHESGRP